MKQLNALWVMLILLAGCAQLGLSTPQTFDQKLAVAYGTHTAIERATATELKAGHLKKSDAQEVLTLADQSKALLDAARMAGDTTVAQNKLTLAVAVLTQIQTYINTRSK